MSTQLIRSQIGTFNLSDITDTSIATPTSGYTISWNGSAWVASPQSSVSGGSGIIFYLDDTNIIAKTSENNFEVNTLSKTPITTTEVLDSTTLTNTTQIVEAYLYNAALNRTSFDAGSWKLGTYASINSLTGTGTSEVITSIRHVISFPDSATTSGSGTSRTVTLSSGSIFVSGDFNADQTLTGYVQTPKGLYKITGYTSSTVVTIETPSAYVNESSVTCYLWRFAFNFTTGNITTTTLSLYPPNYAQSAIVTNATDKIGALYFVKSTYIASKTITFSHNGTARYSYFQSPISTLHNELAGVYPVGAAENYGHLGFGAETIYGAKTFNSLLTTKASFTDLAYNGVTLDNTILIGADPANHGISRFYVTNATAGFSYLDINMFTNSAYLYIGRLTNPRVTGSYPNQYLYNYHLQRNIRFAAAGANANVLETWNENDLPGGTDLTGTSSSIAYYQRIANGSINQLGALQFTCEGAWTTTSSTRNSGIYLQVSNNGSIINAAHFAYDQTITAYNTFTTTKFISTSGEFYLGTPNSSSIGSWAQIKTGTGLATTYKLQHYEDVSGDGSAYGYVDMLTVDYLRNVSTVSSLSGIYGDFFGGVITATTVNKTYSLKINATSGAAILGINQNNASLAYCGINLQRQGVEKWFIGIDNSTNELIFRINATSNPVRIDTGGNLLCTQNIYSNANILAGQSASYYWSVTGGGTNNDARIYYNATNWYFQRRESSAWVDKLILNSNGTMDLKTSVASDSGGITILNSGSSGYPSITLWNGSVGATNSWKLICFGGNFQIQYFNGSIWVNKEIWNPT